MKATALERLEALARALDATGITVTTPRGELPLLEATALYRAASSPGGPGLVGLSDEDEYHLSETLGEIGYGLEQRQQERRIAASVLQSLALGGSNGNGGFIPVVAPSSPLFETYAREWMERRLPALRYSTQRRYKGDLETKVIPYFKTSTVAEIRPKAIKDFAASLVGSLARESITGVVRVLITVLNSAAEDEVAAPLPKIRLNLPKEEGKRSTETLSRGEIATVLDYLERVWPEWWALFVALGDTGCRLGEAVGLHWDCVDFDQEIVVIRRSVTKSILSEGTKTGTTRVVPMTPRLARALQRQAAMVEEIYPDNGNKGRCFPSRNKKGDVSFISQGGASQRFRRAIVDSGVRDIAGAKAITIHSLRRSYVDSLRLAGIDPVVEHALVGHSSEAMRSHYSSVGIEERRAAIGRLGGRDQGPGDGPGKDEEKG